MTVKSKILIVDDDQSILGDVKTHLANLGYEVETALDGLSGLHLFQTCLPDLVVLDITFPVSLKSRSQVVDGVEVLRKLRESSNVPILMLSSTDSSAVKVMALSIGA
ncbi:MAG: response regulator, partial [Candidatus Hinthialibacter sp.]